MKTVTKPIITAASGFVSFCLGAWLRLEADPFSTLHLPRGLAQDGERLSALVTIASAFLWLGVALLVLSAAAWLFFAPADSGETLIDGEPVA